MVRSVLYVVKRDTDRLVFVPSLLFGRLMVGGFGAGSAFAVYLSTLFFRRANLWFGAMLILLACYMVGLAIRAWRTRQAPLSVEFCGHVSYGDSELCTAGSARAVRIVSGRGGERNDCEVCLEIGGGKLVSIPSQYFNGFRSLEDARSFARELADALGVEVIENRRPLP